MMYIIYLVAFDSYCDFYRNIMKQPSHYSRPTWHFFLQLASTSDSFQVPAKVKNWFSVKQLGGMERQLLSVKAWPFVHSQKLSQKSEDLFEILCLEHTKKFLDSPIINLL